MNTSYVYRIHSHCCRVLSFWVLQFDFMHLDIRVLETFLVAGIKTTSK